MPRAIQLQHKSFAFKADQVNEDGTFSGYASTFGNLDHGGDIVAPGAFSESIIAIKATGAPLPLLWQHDYTRPIGGSEDLREDAKGLYMQGFLVIDKVKQAQEAHALMQRKIVRAMSIGYRVISSTTDDVTGIRTLKKVDLVEISPVTFPMNDLARIDQVKSILEGGKLPTLKEFESFLREAGGFSKTQAAAIASRGLAYLHRSESDGEGSFGAKLLSILNTPRHSQ
jgi:HK97 family phage prohead protease